VFNDVSDRFREELDYLAEAEHQQEFARIHSDDPHVVVPNVVENRTSRRVLTTEFIQGSSLAEAVQSDESARRKYCSTLWRFEFKSLLRAGKFNADPHPGNFFFLGDGRIAFIDFGCVQTLEEPLRMAANRVHCAALRRDEGAFARDVAQMLGTRGGSYEKAIIGYIRRCFQPVFDSPFRVTPEYVKSVVLGVRALKGELFAKDKSFVMPPRGLAFMNRLQFGFFSILAKLDATVDYAAIESAFLESIEPAGRVQKAPLA
jgi:predicted unusual protein kinase regulating ubiquinone biosynthesis (AarF/ABC1/UbiB family)